jgi:transcriptional regulator with XRE-family HTH domain
MDEQRTTQPTMADRLAWACLASGVSNTRLAEIAQVSRPFLLQLRTGKRLSMGYVTALRLCRTLGLDPFWLAYGEGKRPPAEDVRAAVERGEKLFDAVTGAADTRSGGT